MLAGGGARGAYEIGALSVLLRVEQRGERPEVIVGTSVGAIRAFLAATRATRGKVAEQARTLWEQLDWNDVLVAALADELARLGALVIPGARGGDCWIRRRWRRR